MDLVSIVVPFLNPNERFFREAIDSVLAQSHPNWELLLVDDGSDETTRRIAAGMAEVRPGTIKLLQHDGHENLGTSASRNLGIRHAVGNYIAFLDADDIWLPNKLAEQVSVLEAHREAAMVFSNTLYWYGWTGREADEMRDFLPRLGIRTPCLIPAPRYLELSLRGRAAVPSASNIFLRRQSVEAVGGFERSFRGLYDDQVFYAKIWLEHGVYIMPGHWDKYRQHEGSMCAVGAESSRCINGTEGGSVVAELAR